MWETSQYFFCSVGDADHAKLHTNAEVTFTVAQKNCEISWTKSTHDNRIRFCSYSGWSNEFAAMTNRVLLGLKVNFV